MSFFDSVIRNKNTNFNSKGFTGSIDTIVSVIYIKRVVTIFGFLEGMWGHVESRLDSRESKTPTQF